MNFEILDVDALARIGKIKVNNKEMVSPNLFPVIHPYKNIISPTELKNIGAECLFTNAYILYQNRDLRDLVLKKGIHDYINYDGIIATDSGAFQQYMYNNHQFNLNPKDIEEFQEDLGSDLPVILDIPVQLNDDYETAKEKVIKTIQRAKDNINRRRRTNSYWIGPVHGGRYFDLLKKSSIEMNKLDFAIYAIGGLVKAFLDYRFDLTLKILLTVKKNITPNKPIHMFGLGLPQFFSLAVACGCDLMDSAAYILFAKENRYFTLSTGTKNLIELEEFPCHCPICTKYSPTEMKKFDDALRIELLAKHNLYLSFSELRTIRQAIKEGNLWELVEQRIRIHPNLVKAATTIKQDRVFFELHEKIYKKHGRLFASAESISRPVLLRYEQRIINNYRVPKDTKYLIILPELDVKGINSPSINQWLNYINNIQTDFRKSIHIVFYSSIYGIIPIELIDTFPMGQYESFYPKNENDLMYEKSIKNSKAFFKTHLQNYRMCGVLIPEQYINQFGELEAFPKNHPIQYLKKAIRNVPELAFSTFNEIERVLEFFKSNNTQ